MVIDDLDRSLLQLLGEDARRSFRTLASMAGTTVPTVSARIRRMEELGIIQGYKVVLDAARFGVEAPDVPEIDLKAPVAVLCDTCGQETRDPRWAHLDGKRHPFCCPMCKQDFVARHERFHKALQ